MNNYPDCSTPVCYTCKKSLTIEIGPDTTDQVCYDDLNNLVWECEDCHHKHQAN